MIKKLIPAVLALAISQGALASSSSTNPYGSGMTEIRDEVAALKESFQKLHMIKDDEDSGSSGGGFAAVIASAMDKFVAPTVFKSPGLLQTLSLGIQKVIENALSNDIGTGDYIDTLIATAPIDEACLGNSQCLANSLQTKLKYYGDTVTVTDPYAISDGKAAYAYPQPPSGGGIASLIAQASGAVANAYPKATNALLGGGNLIDPLRYRGIDEIQFKDGTKITNQAQSNKILIDYLVGAVPPSIQKKFEASGDQVYQMYNYKAALRSFAAMKSFMYNQLMSIYSIRLPNGNAAGMSQLEIEKEMATHRVSKAKDDSNGWYAKMEKASPLTVQRETAYLLAEMNYQLYLNRRVNERMLAVLTILGSTSANNAKPFAQDD